MNKYVLQEGDSISKVANKFNVDPNELVKINNILDFNSLRVGMELIIPLEKQDYFNIYVIESGDSLYRIAEKYNINPTLLASLNGLNMEDYIYPGQELLIPKSGYSYYITAEGDTLDTVSDSFKVRKEDLINQNPTIYLLKEQVLVVKR